MVVPMVIGSRRIIEANAQQQQQQQQQQHNKPIPNKTIYKGIFFWKLSASNHHVLTTWSLRFFQDGRRNL
jgi:hypothetical protein